MSCPIFVTTAGQKTQADGVVLVPRYLATQKEAHGRAVSATHRPLFDQQLSRDNAYGWEAPPPPPPQLHLSSLRAGSNLTTTRKTDSMPALEPIVPASPVTVDTTPAVETQKESFGSVKEILTKFVQDLNCHLADNFGDEASGFKLDLPASNVEEKKVEEKKIEEKVPVVHDSTLTCFCDRCLQVPPTLSQCITDLFHLVVPSLKGATSALSAAITTCAALASPWPQPSTAHTRSNSSTFLRQSLRPR